MKQFVLACIITANFKKRREKNKRVVKGRGKRILVV